MGIPGKASLQNAELAVFRAEIVPPHADAMRFIDGDGGDAAVLEKIEESLHQQPFGRHVEEFEPALAQPVEHFVSFRVGHGAVQPAGGDAVIQQRVDLVFHQRDQRRNDERQVRQGSAAGA